MWGRSTRSAAAMLLAACLATLAGCSDEGPPLTDRKPAPQAVKDAVKALADAGFGTYSMTLDLGGRTYTETGGYQLKPAAQSLTRHVDGGDPADVQAIGTPDSYYVKAAGLAQPDGCWVQGQAAHLADVDGAVYDPALPTYSGAVVVASTARGTTYVDDHSEDVNGDLALPRVLELAGPDLPGQLGVTGGRVNAEFHISNGVLTGYTVATHDFATTDGIPRSDADQVGHARLDVTFDVPQNPVKVDAPPSDQVVRADGTASSGDCTLAH